jgi:hypothetical protein
MLTTALLQHCKSYTSYRRVTPHCVYVTEGGYAQVSDMSCATKMTGSRAYTMIGDPQYLAPEQISGQVTAF